MMPLLDDSLSKPLIRNEDLFIQFWEKVKIKSLLECWQWLGYPGNRRGRPRFGPKKTSEIVYRFAWITFHNREIPEGLCACHSCDNPLCCNPFHIFLGTHADNMRDRNNKGRQATGKTLNELAPNRILDDRKVLEIKKLLKEGEIARVIAAKYGVSQSAIYNIKSGRWWKHLKGLE